MISATASVSPASAARRMSSIAASGSWAHARSTASRVRASVLPASTACWSSCPAPLRSLASHLSSASRYKAIVPSSSSTCLSNRRATGLFFADPRVRVVSPTKVGGGVPVGVVRPQGAQHQDRRAGWVGQQAVYGCGNPFAYPAVGGKIVLCLVQPHHRMRCHPYQFGQGRLGVCGIEGMPQAPPRCRQQLHGLPACPGLACRRRADQHRHCAVPRFGRSDHACQFLIVWAAYVTGQCGRPTPPALAAGSVSARRGDVGSRMDFQIVRIPLRDQASRYISLRHGCLPGRGVQQLQQDQGVQAQGTCQRAHRIGGGRRCGCAERLADCGTPQMRSAGQFGLVQTPREAPGSQPGPQLGQCRWIPDMICSHASPLSPFLPSSCSSLFIIDA